MGKPKKTIKKKNKKWISSGYYIDDSGSWTLLIAADGSGKTKRIKGVV